LRISILTREYPPDVYGGAGIHVEYLSKELARLANVEVRCWGEARPAGADGPRVRAYKAWDALDSDTPYSAALETMSIDLAMAAGMEADVVHSHTWYANLGGHLAHLIYGIPHLMTSHSLEPLRPWKAEQLGGGGYRLSSFCERTGIESASAVIAVSRAMKADILRAYPEVDPTKVEVILNGIDSDEYQPDPATDVLEKYGVDASRPYVVFVGRITRQKGVSHLLDAVLQVDPAYQVVLCAGAPDTPEIGQEVEEKVERIRHERGNIVWLEGMVPKQEVIQLLTHAAVFVCPSVYEPLGIVNLEAMACETAVVATATGGIPEVVVEGETGLLVPFEQAAGNLGGPADPARFAAAIAERLNRILADPQLARRMGAAGRRRAVDQFSWKGVAERTLALYARILKS
jgi:starch synthase